MSTYLTIHTNYGLAALAAAESSGIPINLTHMAVGDGNGSPVTPDPAMTSLVHERFRTTINLVQQDPANPNIFYVEMLIPADTGGWTIREFGIFDDTGALFAVGNFPATYKTVPTDGASSDMVLRATIEVSNASVITLVIDPAVVIASRAWVLATVTKCWLLPGGTTGQVLRKVSNTCGDTEWADPTAVNVIVNVVQEIQSVTANPQLTFTMATCTTLGLSVHVGGALIPKRAGAGGWQQGANNTQVVLGTQYPIGTEIVFLQNEPANSLPEPLDQSLNLSDLENVAVARNNIDVYSRTETKTFAPVGEVAFFARGSAPSGWLKCNGANISRTTYADLFAVMGTTFGVGDGSTTFALPDLRGEFLRGLDDGRGVDAGRTLGGWQVDDFKSHNHTGSTYKYLLKPPYGGSLTGFDTSGSGTEQAVGNGDGGQMINVGGTETRPRNVALLACIKY